MLLLFMLLIGFGVGVDSFAFFCKSVPFPFFFFFFFFFLTLFFNSVLATASHPLGWCLQLRQGPLCGDSDHELKLNIGGCLNMSVSLRNPSTQQQEEFPAMQIVANAVNERIQYSLRFFRNVNCANTGAFELGKTRKSFLVIFLFFSSQVLVWMDLVVTSGRLVRNLSFRF